MERKVNNEKMNWRKVDIQAEVRSQEGEGKKLILRGYPIVFNTPTIIRGYYDDWEETISSDALRDTDLSTVYLLVGHNPDNVLARAGVNMRLEVDETGLFFEAELPNTQYARDWYNLVESGIVDGMSFAFESEGDTWTQPTKEEKAKRVINRIKKLWEITITPFPAYEVASVIAKNNRAAEAAEKARADADTNDEAAEKARAELEEKLKKLEAM